MGDREEGEGSSRKLVESQGGREGEGDGSFFVEKQRQKRANLESEVDSSVFLQRLRNIIFDLNKVWGPK